MNKYVRFWSVRAPGLDRLGHRLGAVRVAFVACGVELWLAAVALLCVFQTSAHAAGRCCHASFASNGHYHACSNYLIGMYFNLLLPTSVGGDVMAGVGSRWRLGSQAGIVRAVLLDRLMA